MIKRIIIRWALKQIIKIVPDNVTYAELDQYGIEDILEDNVDPKALHIVVRKDLSTL